MSNAATQDHGPMSLGERMVTAARLLAAEHVAQEVAAIRAARSAHAGVFAQVPIVADETSVEVVRVSVRRAERKPDSVVRRAVNPFGRTDAASAPRRRAA